MSELLVLAGVNTHIGPYHILQGVDFVVPHRLTVLLTNGAGGTCRHHCCAPAGRIDFDGATSRRSTPAVAQLGIGYVPESMGIFAGLAVRENLTLAARDGPIDAQRLEWIFGFFPALKKFWNLPAGHLSGGQKQMLAIARAIVEPTTLLLID